MREQALSRKREVIYNNDGNEPYIWPTNLPFSVQAFLDMRTTPTLGSQVDTVFYCPVSSSFGVLTANIPSADLMLLDLGTVKHLAGKKTVLQQFLDLGTDPVREVVSWCRTNGFDVFVPLRVNDTHDQASHGGPPLRRRWGLLLQSLLGARDPRIHVGRYGRNEAA